MIMMVWLHTASPPQHVASVSEMELAVAGRENWIDALCKRRAIHPEFAGVFEDPNGEVSLHIFDTLARADAWRARNPDMDYLI